MAGRRGSGAGRRAGAAMGAMCLLVGCGRAGYDEMDAGGVDAAGVDAAGVDGGPRDGGTGPTDGGLPDGHPAEDGGVAGDSGLDGGVDGSVGDPDAGVMCATTCRIDLTVDAPPPCAGGSSPVTSTAVAGGRSAAIIDMTGFTSLRVSLSACDVTGFTFHMGDSPTNDGYGGDGLSSSNDAELQVAGGGLAVYGNDMVSGAIAMTEPSVLPTSGCGSYELLIGDQRLSTPLMTVSGPELFRIDPPTDTEGTPDALWYLGANRTYGNAGRTGTGLRELSLCFN